MPLTAVGLGAPSAVIGVLGSLIALLPLFTSLYIGIIVDRTGVGRPLTLGLGALVTLPMAMAVFPTLWTLALVQLFVGFAHLLTVVASQAHVARLGGGMGYERRFGLFTSFVSVGQLIGPLAAGLLVDWVGYSLAFVVAGTLSGAGLLLAHVLGGDQGGSEDRAWPAVSKAIATVRESPGAVRAIGASATIILLVSAFQIYFPVRLQTLAYPATAIGLLISLRAFASLLVRPLIPWLVTRLGSQDRTFATMSFMAGLALGIMGFSPYLSPLVLASLVLGAAHGVTLPLSMVAMVQYVPLEMKGIALGLRLTGNYAAQFLGPILLGAVASLAGVAGTLAASGVLALPACVLMALRDHNRRRYLQKVGNGGE